ncbi:MAG: efflux RND transporter periplasmic adaptor subunit [Gemmatimonadaceae bacterium]|nr:efflux RND transporter periplasmic adaptor subunit [Gemmatimonadaceae bacterium]
MTNDSIEVTRFRLSRPRIIGIAIGVLLIAGLAALWIARRSPKNTETHNGASATGTMAGMNMSGGGSARLTSAQIRQFGVTLGIAEERVLTSEMRTAGAVTADETRIAQVAPKFGGFVERLYVDFTGQSVRRGEALMDVYSPELLAAQQELLAARGLQRTIGESTIPGVPGQSGDLVAAARRRLELLDVSAPQIDALLRTGVPTRTVTLYSPATGIVTEKNVVRGQAIQAGQMLYTIADLSSVWIDAALRDGEASAVRVGSGADVELSGLPGRILKGQVSYIYPTLDSVSRTVRARIAVANPGGVLKPGMYATVRLYTPSRRALTVPTSAVVRTGARTLVFVDMGDGELMPHEVTLGAGSGDYTEVLSGVVRGARVVTSAQYLLDSESNLAEVMRSMVGQGGATEMNDMAGMPMPVIPDSGANAKPAEMKGMKMPEERR